ncbi:MAG TPA: ABC transporter ATP-binding protein [Falsiroseomonas sp.]|jgi:peptide/nickel transport system ATP-binding protein|nr:ABC transporter ATP-binding protein [Falsiroseomonas sp.]
MDPLLDIRDLTVTYRTPQGPVRAVDAASFAVPRGEMVGLVGESGCGKTTVARAVMGVVPRSAEILGGPVLFEGRDLIHLSERDRRALRWREMAFIPQTAMSALDPVYRVGRQIEEVLVERGGRSRAAARARAAELFGLVGIDVRRLDDYPHQFSGGMKQRASIAIALALEPKLVLADEPVTALDVIVQRQVLDVLKALQARMHLSVVLVTHDISVVAYACDRVVVMYAGRVVETGRVAEVLERPRHPYTMGLTNAFPDLESAAGELVPIEGSPPSLLDPPPGCRFAPRCPFSQPRCTASEPPLLTDGEDHAAACWRAEEAPALRLQAAEAATWRR